MAEVEVMRGNRKIPREVILSEMKIQSIQGKVNLISPDLFSYGDEEEIISLLKMSSEFGKVFFNQISLKGISKIDLRRVSRILNLNEKNYRTPVLSKEPGLCNVEVEGDEIKELNNNFIYPMIFVPTDSISSLEGYKALVIPLPSDGDNYYEALYKSWNISRKIIKNRIMISLIDKIILKNKETKGEFLRKLNVRSPIFLVQLFSLLLKS
jgi:hypothetical protein